MSKMYKYFLPKGARISSNNKDAGPTLTDIYVTASCKQAAYHKIRRRVVRDVMKRRDTAPWITIQIEDIIEVE